MARRRHRWDPLLVALVVLIAVSLLAFGLRRADTGTQVVMFWALMITVQTCFAVFSWRAARFAVTPPGAGPQEASRLRAGRRMWRLFSAAGVVLVGGNLAQLVIVARNPVSADAVNGSEVQMLSIAAAMVLMVAGMLGFPLSGSSGAERLRLRIDVATVMAAAVTFSLWVLEVPAGAPSPEWAARLAATTLVQPGLFLVAIFAVVKILLGGSSPFTRAAGIICGLTAVVQGLIQAVPLSYYLYPQLMSWLFGANVLGSAMIAIGARVQERQVRADARRLTGARRHRPYSLLPFAALGAVWTLTLAVFAVHGPGWRSWLVWGGSAVTTLLVVLRQTAAFRHIAELLRERDELTVRLRRLAYTDALTGLANRGLFMRRLAEALDAGPVTVFLVDLDDFKPVNDAHGHAAGDRLLIEVGRRLRSRVRTEDLIARLGGDEFAVLVRDASPGRGVELAAEIERGLRGSVEVGPARVALGASVGWASGGPGSHDPDTLLHEADMAMYAAKRRIARA